ncbi:MAG: T9SS type A sorting domain-containing protein [Chlorobi bacterium]|nr:T9SS type A sorting domain-containing protein [Chlorobiota bacterium]
MKKLTYIILLLLLTQTGFSQWEKTTWKSEARMSIVFASGDTIITTKEKRIMLSDDFGKSWVEYGWLPHNFAPNDVLITPNTIFVGGFGFLKTSTDMGETWQLKTNGMPSFPIINSFIQLDNKIFAGTADGIFVTTNMGDSWVLLSEGLGNSLSTYTLATVDNNIFAAVGSDSGIYLSIDLGKSWELKSTGLPLYGLIDQISVSGEDVYICYQGDGPNGNDNEVYYSTNLADSWNKISTPFLHREYISIIASVNNTLFISDLDSLYCTSDKGITWINKTDDLPDHLQYGIYNFYVDGDNIYAETGVTLYVSNDDGESWECVKKEISYGSVCASATIGDTLFIGTTPAPGMTTFADGIFSSTDKGITWEPKGLKGKVVFLLYVENDYIYAITNHGNFRSTDRGNSWQDQNVGYPDSLRITDLSFTSGRIYAACRYDGVKISEDNGITWMDKDAGLPVPKRRISSINVKDDIVYVGLSRSFFISYDYCETWIEKNKGLPDTFNFAPWQIEFYGDNIYLVSENGIFCSSDNAENWSLISEDLPKWSASGYVKGQCKIMFVNNTLIAVIHNYKGGVFITYDNGKHWQQKNEGITTLSPSVATISKVDDYLFVSTGSYRYGSDGDAIFKAKISDIITGIVDVNNPPAAKAVIFPNPSNDNSKLIFNLEQPSKITISIFNDLGIEISRIVDNQNCNKGQNQFEIYLADLPTGVYYCILTSDYFKETIKFVVIH